jgi:hypothetical protein
MNTHIALRKAGVGHLWTFAPVNRAPHSGRSTVIGGGSPYIRDLELSGIRLDRSHYQRLATRFQENVKYVGV